MEDDQKKISSTGATQPAVSSEQPAGKDNLKNMTLEQLNTLLAEVLEHEDYIKAIAIRDEIKSRGGKE